MNYVVTNEEAAQVLRYAFKMEVQVLLAPCDAHLIWAPE